MTVPEAEIVLEVARRQGVVRPRDVVDRGVTGQTFKRLLERGILERVGRGMYQLTDGPVTEHRSIVQVAKRVPQGVVCLLSALRFHDLTTQAPFEVWLAIHGKARAPKVEHPPLRLVRMSGAALSEGIEQHVLEGVEAQIFSAAKTVADCFKYRNKIGLDVAIEALRDYRRERRSLDDLWRLAGTCRVQNVMRPYLEALG
jgi:predicted transcriptional regulator of viral defense system